MVERLARQVAVDEFGGIDPAVVRVGADVIELLTSGMYLSPITIFREYVQNAADALDAARAAGLLKSDESGRVEISFDHPNRAVSIRDNGFGIPSDAVASVLLAIGGSSKRGTVARGFRGVGRLSGLAYCRELEFKTKAAGDTQISTMTFDCRALRSRVAVAQVDADLREIVSSCVRHEKSPAENADEHFFEVTLRNVVRHRQDVLLNERAVASYLAQVAPVPFAEEFTEGRRIADALAKFLPDQVPIDLLVAGEVVYRPFRDLLIQPGTAKRIPINEVELFELADVDGEVGAVGWLGHHDYVSSISTSLGVRGLRARVGDVQIGEASLFDEIFNESRFNGWTIGEVHILDRRIVPNGRRDNFEVTHHTYNLLTQLGPIASAISQRCRSTSVSRNATLIISNTLAELRVVVARVSIESGELSRGLAAIQRCKAKLKSVADEEVREAFRVELDATAVALEARRMNTSARIIASDEAVSLVMRIVTNREQAKKLIEELRRLEA